MLDKSKFLQSTSFGKAKEKYDLMTADLKFDFQVVNEKYLRKNEKVKKTIKNFMSLRHIDMIGTTEFIDGCAHLEEYYDVLSDMRVENQGKPPEVKDKELSDYLTQKVSVRFKFQELKRGIETNVYELIITEGLKGTISHLPGIYPSTLRFSSMISPT